MKDVFNINKNNTMICVPPSDREIKITTDYYINSNSFIVSPCFLSCLFPVCSCDNHDDNRMMSFQYGQPLVGSEMNNGIAMATADQSLLYQEDHYTVFVCMIIFQYMIYCNEDAIHSGILNQRLLMFYVL